MRTVVSRRRLLVESLYVLIVAVTAALGFVTGSTAAIVLAAVLALPASLIAVPGFYVVYGLLALVPGANPDTASGSGTCTADGSCRTIATGDPAAWFTFTTEVAGVVALGVAALVNVLVLRLLQMHRYRRVSV